MPSTVLVGSLLGFGVQVYTNAVRKLPLLRSPWQHAIAAGVGAAFTTWLVRFEEQTAQELSGAGSIALRGPGPEIFGCHAALTPAAVHLHRCSDADQAGGDGAAAPGGRRQAPFFLTDGHHQTNVTSR